MQPVVKMISYSSLSDIVGLLITTTFIGLYKNFNRLRAKHLLQKQRPHREFTRIKIIEYIFTYHSQAFHPNH